LCIITQYLFEAVEKDVRHDLADVGSIPARSFFGSLLYRLSVIFLKFAATLADLFIYWASGYNSHL